MRDRCKPSTFVVLMIRLRPCQGMGPNDLLDLPLPLGQNFSCEADVLITGPVITDLHLVLDCIRQLLP